jgi:hypothetical protein
MMTKWDTIQADVADAYRHLDDVEGNRKRKMKISSDLLRLLK